MKKLLLVLCCVAVSSVWAQTNSTAKKHGYDFTDIKVMPCTSVKNQDMSGTCWAFSGLSFLESEMMRIGKDSVSLSSMWIVRNTYIEKAIKYVRMGGTITFSPGGALADVFSIIKKYGVVPDEIYRGLNYGSDSHRHSELHAVLKSYIATVAKNPNKGLSTAWLRGFVAILDEYLGAVPEKFTFRGVEYTPKSFATATGLNMDDYVAFTSFTHHPFYEPFAIEVEDNWSWGLSYNLPIAEFSSLFETAIDKGYTIYWDADVSERSCSPTTGYAAVPVISIDNVPEEDRDKWLAMNSVEQGMYISNKQKPGIEVVITQELRQDAFDAQRTTDDHGMHIIGKGVDQLGTKYYKVKNSWGTGGQSYEGYFYASYNYTAYKTIGMIINKNAVPKELLKKLSIR